jgi:hypothetical protein
LLRSIGFRAGEAPSHTWRRIGPAGKPVRNTFKLALAAER